MSLMRTLAKVAMGVALAKGASSMMRGSRGRRGGGGLLGGLGTAAGAGGLGAALGPLLSGRGGGSPGLGGLLERLGGSGSQGMGGARADLRGTRSGAGGGLDGLLGGLLGGSGAAASGGLLSQLAGRAPQRPGEPAAPFGETLNAAFDPEREEPPATPEQEAAAGLMLRAMIQAARSDGAIDGAERERLLSHLDEIDSEERRFVEEELQAPVDPEGLARQVPRGLEPQVYAMSLMAIDLDSRAEAEHLDRLARAMGLERETVDRIHEEVGAPPLHG